MAERLVINTGPIIALAHADALSIAQELPYDFLCPTQVRDELMRGIQMGLPVVNPTWLKIELLKRPLDPLAGISIDMGEAAVIQLALEQQVSWVCMDDWKGRRAALAVGLNVTGTLGLLLKAKALKIIPAVRPFVDRLLATGRWFHPDLVRRVLEQVGE